MGVDEDSIQAKFITKHPVTKKSKYKLETVHDQEHNHKISQKLAIVEGNNSKIYIDAKSNTKYTLGIFLAETLISNTVTVMTSKSNFNATNNYSPSAPSIEGIKQYYDEGRDNILIIWDPPQIIGDKILYRIKLSNRQQTEIVYDMPYRLSCSWLRSIKTIIELRIATISVIDGNKYEGKFSDAVHVNL